MPTVYLLENNVFAIRVVIQGTFLWSAIQSCLGTLMIRSRNQELPSRPHTTCGMLAGGDDGKGLGLRSRSPVGIACIRTMKLVTRDIQRLMRQHSQRLGCDAQTAGLDTVAAVRLLQMREGYAQCFARPEPLIPLSSHMTALPEPNRKGLCGISGCCWLPECNAAREERLAPSASVAGSGHPKVTVPTLEPSRTAILVGSGISISSGVASGQVFTETVVPALIPEEMRAKGIVDCLLRVSPSELVRKLRFECLIESLYSAIDPELLILQYIDACRRPSALHYWAARCIMRGAIVITTNFDGLIEIAYSQLFGAPLRQVTLDRDYRDLTNDSISEHYLIKLHGTIRTTDYLTTHKPTEPDWMVDVDTRQLDTLTATLASIGSLARSARVSDAHFRLPDTVHHCLETVLTGKDLLVAGYSGVDDFDVMPSLRAMRASYNRVVWVKHAAVGSRVRYKMVGRWVVVFAPTDSILPLLLPGVPLPGGSLLDFQLDSARTTSSTRLERFVEEWSDFVGMTPAKQYLIAGKLLRTVGASSNAIDMLECGVSNSEQGGPDLYLALAQFSLEQGRYTDAQEYFEDAVQVATRMDARRECREALVGALVASWFCNTICDCPAQCKEALKDLFTLFEAAEDDMHLMVHCGLSLCRILRLENTKRADRARAVMVSYLNMYRSDPVFTADKVLYANFLKERVLCQESVGEVTVTTRKELLDLYGLLGLRFERALLLRDLAETKFFRGDLRAARSLGEESAAAFETIGEDVGAADADVVTALALFAEGADQAERILNAALSTFMHNGLDRRIAAVDALLKYIECSRNDSDPRPVLDQLTRPFGDTLSFERGLRCLCQSPVARMFGRGLLRLSQSLVAGTTDSRVVERLRRAWPYLKDRTDAGIGECHWLSPRACAQPEKWEERKRALRALRTSARRNPAVSG